MRKSTITAGFGLFTALVLTSASFAGPITEFSGSRADVRSFCTGADYHLLDGGNYSLCLTPTTDVVCDDTGMCGSSDLKLALAAGFQKLSVALADLP